MKEIVICIILLGIFGLNSAHSQDKVPSRIYLEHFKNDELRQLSIRVITKKDKRYKPTEGVKVELYKSNISSSSLLCTLLTKSDGTNSYTFNKEQYDSAENAKIATYYAVIQNNDTIKSKEVKIVVKEVNLDVSFDIIDSVKQIHVRVFEKDSIGSDIPQEDVKIRFLVDRPLSALPIGGDYNKTDENGKVSIDFPNDLPGDEEGIVKIFVRIIENDDYGIVEISEFKQWGIPLSISDDSIKRTLWASGANAPISLIVLVNSIIAVVWLIIFYIVFKVFKIRKLG